MTHFKAGDLICGFPKANRRYTVTNMHMTKARVVKTYDDGSMTVEILDHDTLKGMVGATLTVANDPTLFRLLAGESKRSGTKTWEDKSGYDITIFRAPGSDTVVAEVRSVGTLFTGSAKCSKDDEFDICAGAHLAIERALAAKKKYFENLRRPKERTNSRGVKVGDLVKVTEEHCGLHPGDLAEVIGLGSWNAVYLATPERSTFKGNCCVTDKSKLVQPYGYTHNYSVLDRQPVMHKPGESK
jgi:hypothetical protein